jgi:DNA invertase Pin-like site-specific DNA recombinase
MKVGFFVRVSSKSQEYDRQISDLTAYAEKMDYQVVQVISASKTAKEHREAISQLLELARSGKIEKVLVTEVSRLGRRTADILQVIEELSDLRVSVYAHNFGQETLTKEGKRNPTINLVYTLLAEIARMETELLSERIRSGQAEARRKGKKLGRRQGTTKPAEQLLKDYSGVVKDLNAGLSIRQTAAIRKVSKNTVERVKKAMATA